MTYKKWILEKTDYSFKGDKKVVTKPIKEIQTTVLNLVTDLKENINRFFDSSREY